MRGSIYSLVTLLFVTCFAHTVSAACDRKIIFTIQQEKPYQLYNSIITKHYAVLKEDVYSEGFIKKLEDFSNYLDCVSDSLGKSHESLTELKNIRNRLKIIAQRVQDGTFDEATSKVLMNDIANADQLYVLAVKQMSKTIKASVEWQKSVPSKAKDILPDYATFFKNYQATKEQFNQHNRKKPFPIERLFNFLKNQSFIGHKDPQTTRNKMHAFADTLEKLKYRLKKDKKKAWFFKGELQNQIDMIKKEILPAIFIIYPDIITAKVHQKVKLATDKNRVDLVIAAQAVCEHTIGVYIRKSAE